MLAVKNFNKFQHFKDRRPPWIKLYRDLLDDLEWHDLEPKAAKALVMIWLIASENEGKLPEVKKLAFRLRQTDIEMTRLLNSLSHWLEQDDNEVISTCHQPDTPETETETEIETETETELVASRGKPRSASRRPQMCDEEFLTKLQANPAYAMLDVRRLYHKMLAWCEQKHKQPTQGRFIGWLNREDVPMAVPQKKHDPGAPTPYTLEEAARLEETFDWDEWVDNLIHFNDRGKLEMERAEIEKRGGPKEPWEFRVYEYLNAATEAA